MDLRLPDQGGILVVRRGRHSLQERPRLSAAIRRFQRLRRYETQV